MSKKEITIEDLARITQKGFEGVDKKFEGVDKKFEAVDKRFDQVGNDLKLINGKIDAVEIELLGIKKKLDNIVYRHEFELLKDRIVVLERKVIAGK